MRFPHLISTCAAMFAALFSGAGLSQGTTPPYPSKPVVVINPFGGGGPSDLESRLYTPILSGIIGQPVILDYKPGAGTSIGTGYVAKSRPDGYTLLSTTAALTVFPAFYPDLGFDTVKDLATLSMMSKRTSVLMVNLSFPAKTFPEYLAYARANPGKINFGTVGLGDISHLVGAWMHALSNTTITFVPYKATGPMMVDMMAGRVDVTTTTTIAALPVIRSGKVRPLAVLADQRSRQLPDVPTVAESGIPAFAHSNWVGFLAPAATPPAIIARLSDALAKVARTPSVIAELEAQGTFAVGGTPEQFRQYLVAETARWKKIVADEGIKLQE